jgi:O-antigen/teichoic acid export membrane protein
VSSALEIQQPAAQVETSRIERLIVGVLSRIPGFTGISTSRRVVTALRGSTWTIVGYCGGQLLRAATTVVLARKLLGPREFGLVALATVFLTGIDLLTDLGIGLDVVQHPRGDERIFVNTAFMIQVLRGLLIGGVATALAYPFSHFYGQPQATGLIMVCASSVVVRGFASGSIWTLTRHVQIKTLTFVILSGEVGGFLFALIWAWFSPTAWALVAGRLINNLIYVAASHYVSDHKISLDWDGLAAKDIMSFGTGVFVSSATYFLGGEAERLFLAKFATVAELGCYALAVTLAMLPTRGLMQVVGQVFFPMISELIRTDHNVAIRNYAKARRFFFVLGIAIALGFTVASSRVVLLVLGPRYAMAGWMLQLLGIRAAFELYSVPPVNLLLASGVARFLAVGNTLRMVLVSVGIWLVNGRFGIHGIVTLLVFAPILAHLLNLWGLVKDFKEVLLTEILTFVAFIGVISFTFFAVG